MTINQDVIKDLSKKYRCHVWISTDGSLTPLVIMSQRMLNNCYGSVKRAIDNSFSPWTLPAPNGSVASDFFDDMLDSGQADDEYERKMSFLYTWLGILNDEFARRGIQIPS